MALPALVEQSCSTAALQFRSCSLAWSASVSSCCTAVISRRRFASTPEQFQQQQSTPRHIQQQQPAEASEEAPQNQRPAAASNNPSSRLGEVDKDGYQLVYEGFFSRPHKRLKYASLLNTFASFAAAPLIIQYSTASPIARVAVTTSVIAFAVTTTGGLHWFTKPYIHQLWYNKQQQSLKAQTMSLFGGTKWKQFSLSSVTEFNGIHPLANFKAESLTFYIDRGNFPDTELLRRLMPWVAADQADQTPGATPQSAGQHQVD
eukprot:GHUV01003707.1.p1 GENE.GHUV01003707.1~~GHUV01003707.1.p1  ORF type:complete len:261 (+),score=87.29 GHUV01003707.1:632-1414(+)